MFVRISVTFLWRGPPGIRKERENLRQISTFADFPVDKVYHARRLLELSGGTQAASVMMVPDGSIRFNGVRFVAYTMDHEPRHVHGFYAEVEAIIDLRHDGTVALANRTDATRPSNGSKSDIRHVLDTAANYFEELVALWEKHHG